MSRRFCPVIPPEPGILTGTFVFVTPLTIITILAPLRMLELGFSPLQIGGAVATAALISLIGQLPGGVCCDRFGRRLPLMLSFAAVCVAGIGILFSTTLSLFFLSMAFRGLSGSLYWPASQSYASLLDPTRAASVLGRQTGVMETGTITGALLAGYIAALLGFKTAFTLAAVFAFAGAVLSFLTPELAPAAGKNVPGNLYNVFANALRLIRKNRTMLLAVCCALVAAIPLSLNGSFYPVFFIYLGYDERMVGILSAVLNLAVMITGLIFGFVQNRFSYVLLIPFSLALMGLTMLLLAASKSYLQLLPVMALQGFAFGLLLVLRLSLASASTAPENRGSAVALVEIGFCITLFSLPLGYGYVLELIGFKLAFLALGFLLVAASLVFALYFRHKN